MSEKTSIKVGKYTLKLGSRLKMTKMSEGNPWKECMGDIFVIIKIGGLMRIENMNSKRPSNFHYGNVDSEDLLDYFTPMTQQYEFDF